MTTMALRTCATFESDSFNTTHSKPEFIRPDNYGDDVVVWLMEKLRERGVPVDETDPSQEDHGWYVTFGSDRESHDAVVVFAPTETAARWLICIERSVGLFGTILGRRTRAVLPSAVDLMEDILRSAPEIRNLRWSSFEEMRQGNLEDGTGRPRD